MRIGTRSLLYGYHQFLMHPLCVALAWWRLFGFPWDPRLWVAFFVHDLGYWGKANMDGPEGEEHPYAGARIMRWLFDRKLRFRETVTGCPILTYSPWWNFTLYHSRFLAARHLRKPSRLCMADKYVIVLLPTWLQVLLFRLTGEIKEYRLGQNGRTSAEGMTDSQWVEKMKQVVREWLASNGHGGRQEDGARDEDPESELNAERYVGAIGNLLVGLIFLGAAIWVVMAGTAERVGRWFRWKRVCCWCEPQHRMGGNPLARRITHGCCRRALEREKQMIFSHRAAGARPSCRPFEATITENQKNAASPCEPLPMGTINKRKLTL